MSACRPAHGIGGSGSRPEPPAGASWRLDHPTDREAPMPPTADLPCTRHARARSPPPRLPPSLVERVLRYGRGGHDHHGAIVGMMDRAARTRMARDGESRGVALDRLRGVYVVLATDGTIRTVGHRTRRLRH